jgi:hypothetical protein
MYDVIDVCHLRDHVLWLEFENGSRGEIDLSEELFGPVFEPLRSETYFRQVALSRDLGTIVWPNGADFAPEFLYERIRVAA